jgi:hypothetical protein
MAMVVEEGIVSEPDGATTTPSTDLLVSLFVGGVIAAFAITTLRESATISR